MDEHQPTPTTHDDLINLLLQDGLGALLKIAELLRNAAMLMERAKHVGAGPLNDCLVRGQILQCPDNKWSISHERGGDWQQGVCERGVRRGAGAFHGFGADNAGTIHIVASSGAIYQILGRWFPERRTGWNACVT